MSDIIVRTYFESRQTALVAQVYCFMSMIETDIQRRLVLPRELCFR
ncbi:hypothetical protein GPAL_4054 [Glaciecola pallidula DSM 14239 = ACAM 615]|uniref:Uncharacterized protein n=1 Tax=Brumicola pallidula DSM 14239 = ACAM 615 TaxID=1121922 RepID=K6ZPU6_9ALTE|nr:hypothetical protein GPAL_4054 [Glaciecola pallidula DSM 14239 = ACAM 615]